MRKKENNYAFIDTQNIYREVKKLGWTLDWRRFRVHLQEHYGCVRAYIFVGYIKDNQSLYDAYDRAVIISSDGDFYSLVRYLRDQQKLRAVLSPSRSRCSALLKRVAGGQIDTLDGLERKLAYRGKMRK